MAQVSIFAPGSPPRGTPFAVMTSGAAPPYIFSVVKPETKETNAAPEWQETKRPGKRPLMHISGYTRPEVECSALLWYPDERDVEGDYAHIYRHAQGVYGVTFSYGRHLSLHRYAVTDLTADGEVRSPRDHSVTRMVVSFTLKELFSASPFGLGPLPGVGPEHVVVGPAPLPAPGRQGLRRWVWSQGDTLERVAFEVYGSQAYWRTIAAANDITDPRPARITIGRELTLP